MKQALLLVLAVAVNCAANESEVGAPHPQLANTETLKVAVAETGASTRWAAQPSNALANTIETKRFEMRVEGLDGKLNQELDLVISNKLDELLAE